MTAQFASGSASSVIFFIRRRMTSASEAAAAADSGGDQPITGPVRPVRRSLAGSPLSHQMADALDEPLDLIRARVYRAAGAHQAVALMTQHPRHGARVEVTVRHEYAASRKCSGHLPRIPSGEREGHRGHALATRRQTVELDSGYGAQALPQPPQQLRSALPQALRHAHEPLAARHLSLRE